MDVDGVGRELVEGRLQPVASEPMNTKEQTITIVISTVVGVILLFLALCICTRCRKKRRLIKKSHNSRTPPSAVYNITTEVQLRTTEDVTRRYERSVSSLSTKSQIYLVPFAVLPPDFDYSSRDVEVKADYVILKDLGLLERYNSTQSEGIVNEAYEKQEPFNPYINGFVPPLVQDAYKKQPAYNPTFY